jgi:predicted dithiol-disulfide oxidoreductase (DUF899 family)
MLKQNPALPTIVSPEDWQKAHEALLAKEKELTHTRDALAAARRRMPMMKVDKAYEFDGANGSVSLLDLFDGRPQLLLYHFMYAPGVHGWPEAGCPGCSMYIDNLGQFALAHLAARDVSFAAVSRGPLDKLLTYKKRMSWNLPWVSSEHNTFNTDFGLTTEQGEQHGLSVFVRDGDEIYRTYFTTARGTEPLGTTWMLLDVTPFGRQEKWEDSPEGRPQSAPYQWWRRHDEYDKTTGRAS